MRKLRYLGLAAPFVALLSILVSVLLFPGFSFADNALSDLGVGDDSAAVFNTGLMVAGAMVCAFSAGFFREAGGSWRPVAVLSAFTGGFLFCVGLFNENFGRVHFLFSVLFFASMALAVASTVLLLFLRKRYRPASALLLLLLSAAGSWLLPLTGAVSNVAIPETVSALAGCAWIVWLALGGASKI